MKEPTTGLFIDRKNPLSGDLAVSVYQQALVLVRIGTTKIFLTAGEARAFRRGLSTAIRKLEDHQPTTTQE